MSGSTSMLELLRNPKDPNWQNGSHRGYHYLLLLKTFFTIILISLIIAEYSLWLHWAEKLTWKEDYGFWFRSGMALVPDVIYTFMAFALIFQKPKIVLGGHIWTFHPAFALTFSIMLFGLYTVMAIFNALGVYFSEYGYDMPSWGHVSLAEAGFEAVLAFCYLWLMVLACIAVHRWRKREEMRPSIERVIELVESQLVERQVAERQDAERQRMESQLLERREHGKTDG